jgi:hypothetical protein
MRASQGNFSCRRSCEVSGLKRGNVEFCVFSTVAMILRGSASVECIVADRKRQYLLLADEDLISLLVEGDARAFATLYDRHGRAAYSLAYRMMGEKQAAEDLVQDALLKVWRELPHGAGQRADVDTLDSAQPRNRPAALAREPPQDTGEGRGLRADIPAERGIRGDLA